jgi:23S rRNA pseudouridine1911/1915/1917 synthase
MPVRSIVIQPGQAGQTVGQVLQGALRLGRASVLHYLHGKKVRLAGHLCRAPGRRVRSGQRLDIVLDAMKLEKRTSRISALGGKKRLRSAHHTPIRSPFAQAIRVRYLDSHIVVVDKPAGLTTVRHASEAKELGRRAQRFLPATLVDLLPGALPATQDTGRIRAVHRLDKETSGLVVLARTAAAETSLGLQFRAHDIEREYLALVRGRAKAERIETYLVRDRGDGRRGSGPPDGGQKAVTNVAVVERLGDFTLVACRLETGRTHQVRIHLGERGTPLCGDRIYDRPVHGRPPPDTSGARRPLLHAAYLALDHPATGQRLSWKAKLPKDMEEMLRKLRSQKRKR